MSLNTFDILLFLTDYKMLGTYLTEMELSWKWHCLISGGKDKQLKWSSDSVHSKDLRALISTANAVLCIGLELNIHLNDAVFTISNQLFSQNYSKYSLIYCVQYNITVSLSAFFFQLIQSANSRELFFWHLTFVF